MISQKDKLHHSCINKIIWESSLVSFVASIGDNCLIFGRFIFYFPVRPVPTS